jgi:hypothetical protein
VVAVSGPLGSGNDATVKVDALRSAPVIAAGSDLVDLAVRVRERV